jgi:hypothetical protein
MNFKEKLIELDACDPALDWMDKNGITTIGESWEKCPCGDWLLWVAARFGLTPERHKKIVLAACEIARMVLKYIPEGENRPLRAIKAAEAWATGDGTIEDVRVAAYAADKAAAHAAKAAAHAANAAAHAANAAAHAAYAVYAAAYAAYATAYATAEAHVAYAVFAASMAHAAYAAYAAGKAVDAAAYATVAAGRDKILKKFADIVRKHLSCPEWDGEENA